MTKWIWISFALFVALVTYIFYVQSASDQQMVAQGMFYPERRHPVLVFGGGVCGMTAIFGFLLFFISPFLPVKLFEKGQTTKNKFIFFGVFLFLFSFVFRYETYFFMDLVQARQYTKVESFYNKIAENETLSSAISKAQANGLIYKLDKFERYNWSIKDAEQNKHLPTARFYLPYSQNSLITILSTEKDPRIIKKICYISERPKEPKKFIKTDDGYTTINPRWIEWAEFKHEHPCPVFDIK